MADFIQIDLPKKYKIIGAKIQLKSQYKIKTIVLKGQIFKEWLNFHHEKVKLALSFVENGNYVFLKILKIQLKSQYNIRSIILKGQIFKAWLNFHHEKVKLALSFLENRNYIFLKKLEMNINKKYKLEKRNVTKKTRLNILDVSKTLALFNS